MKSYFSDWNLFEKIWLVFFSLIGIVLFILWDDTWLGLTAFLTGIVCVVLVAKGKRMNYLFGIPNVILYGWIAYQTTEKFYGELMLNWGYFLPVQIVGWYTWTKNSLQKKDEVRTEEMTWSTWVFWAVVTCVLTVIYGVYLEGFHFEVLPFLDSASTVLSVIAMILMVKRYVEQWIFWIVVDVISIIMWLSVLESKPEAASMILMWSAYLVNAVYGYMNWKKLYKRQGLAYA